MSNYCCKCQQRIENRRPNAQYCWDCYAENKQAYYQAHKAETQAYYQAYYQAHKAERQAYKQAYNQAHKAERQAYYQAYYQAHKAQREQHG
jgi:hypothetical protein